jgi:Glycosyl hydrolase family 26
MLRQPPTPVLQKRQRRRRLARRARVALSLTAALAAAVAAVTLAVVSGPGMSGKAEQADPGRLAVITRARYTPADPKASAAAAKELNYLGNLPVSRQFLTGSWTGFSNVKGGFTGYQDMAGLFHAAGQYPALAECDYNGQARPRHASYVAEGDCNAYLAGYAQQGGLAEVGYQPNSPAGGGFTTGLTKAQVTELLTPGTAAYRNWHKQLDEVAAGLNRLGSRGTTVIFRPLGEMNQAGQSWYWWNGGGWTAADFVQLWRDMFTSVTGKLKHHNVLWDWSVNQDGNASPGAYYPGAGYTDITSLDVFTRPGDGYPAAPVTRYQSVLEPGKPFGFSEVGKDPGLAFDFAARPAKLRDDYPRTSFFLTWNGESGPLGQGSSGARALMNAPGAVNLGYPQAIAGFEGGSTDDWTSSTNQQGATAGPWSTRKTAGSEWAAQGDYALKADVRQLGRGQQVTLHLTAPLDLTGRKQVTAVVNTATYNVPATGLSARLYLRDGRSGTYHPGPSAAVSRTAKGTRLTLSVAGLKGLGDVTSLGVVFTSTSAAASGSVYLDNVVIS